MRRLRRLRGRRRNDHRQRRRERRRGLLGRQRVSHRGGARRILHERRVGPSQGKRMGWCDGRGSNHSPVRNAETFFRDVKSALLPSDFASPQNIALSASDDDVSVDSARLSDRVRNPDEVELSRQSVKHRDIRSSCWDWISESPIQQTLMQSVME